MRLALSGDSLVERIGLAANLAPAPGGIAMYGMPAARTIGVAQKLGIYRRLLERPRGASELATELGLRAPALALTLEILAGLGVLEQDGERFGVARAARKWLDPASPTYVGTWIEHTTTYWPWWGDLERVLREGGSFQIHREPAADERYWRLYITGQYELARLAADEVARTVELPRDATALLDLAGGHGWFAAAICKRHERLRATVVDLPGSAAIGREIIAANAMADRVQHVEGDMFESDLGGPYDGALLFDIVHHLSGEQLPALLARVRAALRPGATIAILDMFRGARRQPASAAMLGLFFHLTSGADLPDPATLARQLEAAGFSRPRRRALRRIPDQALYQARAS